MTTPQNINFGAIIEEYKNFNSRTRGTRSDIKEVSIRLELSDVKKETMTDTTTPEVHVNRGGAGPDLKSSQDLKNDVVIEIDTGACEGLQDRDVKMPLPRGAGTANIKLRKGKQEVVSSQVHVELHSTSGNGASAEVQTTLEDTCGVATYKVYPRGKVFFGSNRDAVLDVKTQKIITDLRRNGSQSVAAFQHDGDGFFWIMQCFFEMKVGVKHSHNWSQ